MKRLSFDLALRRRSVLFEVRLYATRAAMKRGERSISNGWFCYHETPKDSIAMTLAVEKNNDGYNRVWMLFHGKPDMSDLIHESNHAMLYGFRSMYQLVSSGSHAKRVMLVAEDLAEAQAQLVMHTWKFLRGELK